MSAAKSLPLLLACLAAGFGGAGLVLFLRPTPTLAETPQATDAGLRQDMEDLQASLEIHRGRLDVLTEQVSGLGLQRTETDAPSREDLDLILARLEELDRTAPIFMDQPTGGGLAVAIEDVLDHREAVAQQEKEERWERKQQQKLADEVVSLTNKLALTPVQAQDLTAILEQRANGRSDIREAIHSGELSKRDSAEPWAALDRDYDHGLTMLLTPVQLEDYRNLGRRNNGTARQQGKSGKR
ncbi:MAG: hypothetical protein ACYSU1_02220 [Planctomycetota bacterium]|jgi:hypothetical protein